MQAGDTPSPSNARLIQTVEKSVQNLDGGNPDKLMVESSKMTMMIFLVDGTYVCGVGLMPVNPTGDAAKRLEDLRAAFRAKLSR